MKSAWATSDAEAAVARYARDGISRELALRVYTTRLLGQNPKLVLHGGGNTSVKMRTTDLNGEEVDVLCVKGSGWDMATIEPAGLPAVRLEPLRVPIGKPVVEDAYDRPQGRRGRCALRQGLRLGHGNDQPCRLAGRAARAVEE